MGEVVNIVDPYYYVMSEDKVYGTGWHRGNSELYFTRDGGISCTVDAIPPNELKQLMIMWLAINSPESLRFDD